MVKLAIVLNIVLIVVVGASLLLRVLDGDRLSFEDFWLPFFAVVVLLQMVGSQRRAPTPGPRDGG
jgi:hypothetical protein